MDMRLSQVILFVNDVVRMQAFYEGLGLRPVDGNAADGFVRLADPAGGALLALHGSKYVGAETSPQEDSRTKLCFHVDDVERDRAMLVERGTDMRALHRYEGVEFCDGVDPEGNIFQITSRS